MQTNSPKLLCSKTGKICNESDFHLFEEGITIHLTQIKHKWGVLFIKDVGSYLVGRKMTDNIKSYYLLLVDAAKPMSRKQCL